ncbi:MAG: SH3 domain-containing protein [Deltaproteobacteria bacterium]|nr:SH3 domain-containing protein [Candidatus Zymogenaceae bacterium]
MKTKKCLPFTLFLVFLVAAAFSVTFPIIEAGAADESIVSCNDLDVYVADTDPGGANVRSGPGQSYPVVDKLAYGEKVEIRESAGEWVRVCRNIFGSDYAPIGWVSATLLAVTSGFFGPCEDPSGLVPIYIEPGLYPAVIGWAPENTEFRILGAKNRYVKIQYKDVAEWLDSYCYADDPPQPATDTGKSRTTVPVTVPCDNVAAYVTDKDPKGLNIRCGPGTDYAVSGTLPTDRPVQVRIIRALNNWVLIKEPNFSSKGSGEMKMDITGWVKAPLLGVRAENAEDFAGAVSLYKDADAESEVVAEIAGGTAVTILAARGGWLKVRYEKQEGWLAPDAQCGDPFKECH